MADGAAKPLPVWKKENITPIFKKGTKEDPGNYRWLSLVQRDVEKLEKWAQMNLMRFVSSSAMCGPRVRAIPEPKEGFTPQATKTTESI